ncbi:MAG TPA: hypothetical protein VHN18_20825 [Micromonosporaceae bacterium]|nr:hypothetical protein [Micromonosporaceae bacterium]
MNQSELIRRRRQMHRRIREVVADRRLSRPAGPAPAQPADRAPEQPADAAN